MKLKAKFATVFLIVIILTVIPGLIETRPAVETDKHSGTIIEIQKASHYMYLLVNVDGNEFWISTIAKYLPADLAPGESIEYNGGMLIQGFNSTAMKKSFETMLLVSKIKVIRAKPDTIKKE